MDFDKYLTKKVGIIASGIMVVCCSFLITQLFVTNKSRIDLKNQKAYSQVLSDAKEFNADMHVADNYRKFFNRRKFIRLKMDEDKPVAVYCEDDLDIRAKDSVKHIVDYYNKVFSTINKNYTFKFYENEEDILPGSTRVEFINQIVEGNAVGQSNIKDIEKYFVDGMFINEARIYLDWEQMKTRKDFEIYNIAFHEFTHALGLGDVYIYMNKKDTVDMTTIMNTSTWDEVRGLFPNDYAILQALYSNEYKEHESYQEAVEVVNEKIKRYTDSFYQSYVTDLKQTCYATSKLKLEHIPYPLKWRNISVNYGINQFELRLKEDNTCELTLQDEEGNVLEVCEGTIRYIDGVIFINDILVEKAGHYRNSYNKNEKLDIKLSMRLFIDKNGNFVIQDGKDTKYLDLDVLKNPPSR